MQKKYLCIVFLKVKRKMQKKVFYYAGLLFIPLLFSCQPDDEGDEQGKHQAKGLQSLQFGVSVADNTAETRAAEESFTYTTGENNELEITCTVTDMDTPQASAATRGLPTGGTTYGTSRTVQNVYGTNANGVALTVFRKDKEGTVSILERNTDFKTKDEYDSNPPSFTNIQYIWNGSDSWVTNTNIKSYYWFEMEKLRFFGVAPYSKAPSSAAAYNATAGTISYSYNVSESTASAQPDLLVGCTDWLERPGTDPVSVELPMKHALSGIHFIVDNEYTTSGGVTKSKDFKVNSITLTGVKNSGTVTYNYNGGEPYVSWSGQSGSATYSQNFNKSITQSQTTYDLHGASDGTITSSTEEGTTFMLVPQNLGSVTVAINYTYKDNTKTVTGKLFGSNGSKSPNPVSYGSWLPGKIYEYHINSKGIVAHEVGESLMTTSQLVSYTSQSNVTEVELFGTSFNCADVLKMRIDFRQYFKNYTQRYNDITNARLYLELTDASGNVYDTHNSIYYDLKSEVPSSHSFSTGGDDASWVADISSYDGNIVSLKILVEFCNPSTGGKSGTWDLGYADVVVLTMAE